MESQFFADAERSGKAATQVDETKLAEQQLEDAQTAFGLLLNYVNDPETRLNLKLAAIELTRCAKLLGIQMMFNELSARRAR